MMQDDEVTQPAAEPAVQPTEDTETKLEDTEAVAPAPAAEAMPEQPSTASAESPEAAQPAVPEMAPQLSASAPSVNPNLSELRSRANAKRTARREMRLQQILSFASTRKEFSNQDVRDLLHVSQSSVSVYFSELVKQGKLKKEGRARAARYSL